MTTPSPASNMFRLKRPCKNCPFVKKGAIELAPGRVESIIQTLVTDDHSTFHCHKTVHNKKTGGEWNDDGEYEPSGQEAMCMGAAIYLEKIGRPNVAMRLGAVLGSLDIEGIKKMRHLVIEPGPKGAT